MEKLQNWLKQPTSVAGLAAMFGTVSALMSQQLTWAQAGPLLVGAVVSIALPDNSAAQTGAVSIASGAIAAINLKKGTP